MKERWSVLSDVITVSENNTCEHWRHRHKRTTSQKQQIWAMFQQHKPSKSLPCHIHIKRLSPRALDDDNLQGSLKYIRDSIADYLIPGLQPGRADGDSRLSWSYSQEKSKTKGIHITFFDP